METLKCNSFFAIADTHIGDIRFLYETLISTVKRLPQRVEYIIVCGDLVAGRGIYRLQELDAMPVPYQVAAACAVLSEVQQITKSKIILLSGNHDRTNDGIDLTEMTYRYGKSEGLDVEWKGSEVVVKLKDERIYLHHGFGYSRNSPHAPAYLAHLALKYAAFLERGLRITRFVHGHTHWLSHSLYYTSFMVDSLGGFQSYMKAQERLMPMSPPGGLLYTGNTVLAVTPDQKILQREISQDLRKRNQVLYARLCHTFIGA